jgi:trimeric autotransporter adhesin
VVQAGPNIAAISNAASFLPGPVAPGQLVTIFGSEMGPGALTMAGVNAIGQLDSAAAETRVYFDDIPAPLIYTSATQISAIVPYGIDGRASARVSVEYRGVRSPSIEVRIVDSSPAFFTTSPTGQVAALNQDGSVNSTANGAQPGSIIVLYATGEGQTTPAGSDGKIATDLFPKPVAPVVVRINGTVAEVRYAGAAPFMAAGVMQINAVIPADVPRGVSVPVILDVGTTASPAGVTIAIRP